MSNLQFNGAFGQISVDATFHYRFPVLREGRAFIDHPLEEGSCSSILSDSFGRLADFVASKLTAEEKYCSKFELLKLILTNLLNVIH